MVVQIGADTLTIGTAMVSLAAGSTLGIISLSGNLLFSQPGQANAVLEVLRISKFGLSCLEVSSTQSM